MADNKFVWCVAATKLLISEYESYEMLYNHQHPDYKNRNKRLDTYKRIAEIINTVSKGCKVEDIKKKLNGLRSQYLLEKMKVIQSKKSGAEEHDVYKPKVYWFPLLKFLDKSTEADTSESNLEIQSEQSQAGSDIYNAINQNNDDTSEKAETTTLASKSVTDGIKPAVSINKKRKSIPYDDLLVKASATMSEMGKIVKQTSVHNQTQDDALDTFGKFVVSELRGIQGASNEFVLRQTKRKIQQILMDTWDTLDQPTRLLSPASSQESWRSLPQPPHHSYTPLEYNFNNNFNEENGLTNSDNLISDALRMANVTSTDFQQESI